MAEKIAVVVHRVLAGGPNGRLSGGWGGPGLPAVHTVGKSIPEHRHRDILFIFQDKTSLDSHYRLQCDNPTDLKLNAFIRSQKVKKESS